jgi:hypothetical protein
MSTFFHIREEKLNPGDIINPGRWGATIKKFGEIHPLYDREIRLEFWRKELLQTNVNKNNLEVSRMSCTFVFKSEVSAKLYFSSKENEFLYRVEPCDQKTPIACLDMLWLTWMREKPEHIDYYCEKYWRGIATNTIKSDATPSWEYLLACPIRIVEEIKS